MRRLLQGPAWRKGLTHLHELGLDKAAYQISLLSPPACDEALPNEMARLAAYLTPSDIPALDAAMRLYKVEKTENTTYLTPLSDDELVGLAGEDWQRYRLSCAARYRGTRGSCLARRCPVSER